MERESGRLTRVQTNKLEEMMLTIVITETVCLFVTSSMEVMFSVVLVCWLYGCLKHYLTDFNKVWRKVRSRAKEEVNG